MICHLCGLGSYVFPDDAGRLPAGIVATLAGTVLGVGTDVGSTGAALQDRLGVLVVLAISALVGAGVATLRGRLRPAQALALFATLDILIFLEQPLDVGVAVALAGAGYGTMCSAERDLAPLTMLIVYGIGFVVVQKMMSRRGGAGPSVVGRRRPGSRIRLLPVAFVLAAQPAGVVAGLARQFAEQARCGPALASLTLVDSAVTFPALHVNSPLRTLDRTDNAYANPIWSAQVTT